MRFFLLTVFLLFTSLVFSQDTAWKTFVIDENMTAYLPVTAIEIDTTLKTTGGVGGSAIIYKAKTEYTELGITITPGVRTTKSSRNKVYKEVEAGFKESAWKKGYFSHFSDTIIDNITGRKVFISSSPDKRASPITIGYFFLIKNKIYSLVFTPTKAGANIDIRKLLTGCHFTVNSAEIEPAAGEKKYKGAKTKDILISLSIVALILGFIMIRYIKKEKKK